MKFLEPVCFASALTLASTFASSAFADTCDTTWSDARAARQQSRLLSARQLYQQCIDQCTEETAASKDCRASLPKLEQDVPTVVLVATDAKSTHLEAVSVSMDGRLLASRLDGGAIEVDPGVHQFVFKLGDDTVEVQRAVAEGQRDQEVKAQFGGSASAPATPPPVASAEPTRRVAFTTEDSSFWELASSDGKPLCELPCSAGLAPDKGYQLRVKGGGARKTFLGSAVQGSSAVVTPPRGSRGTAALTFIVSAVVTGVGVAVYFAGNTEECGYGVKYDKDGNQSGYYQTTDGKCGTKSPPSGYFANDGHDVGDTADRNRKGGMVLGGLGAAGMVVGGVWYLLSDSEPTITWQGQTGSAGAKKVGFTATPSAVGVLGTF